MNTEPTETPWLTLTHELRAEVSGPVTAATLAAFAIIVPDHATVDVLRQYEGIADPADLRHLIIGTWPHEDIDNIERPNPAADAAELAARNSYAFDVGQDIGARAADYALELPPTDVLLHWWNGARTAPATTDTAPLEGAASYQGEERRAPYQFDRANMPGKGTMRPGQCTSWNNERNCIRGEDHHGNHVYAVSPNPWIPTAANDK